MSTKYLLFTIVKIWRFFAWQSGGLSWQVPTGRRDGRISQASDVSNLPSPFDSVDVQKEKFTAKGLNTQDLVTLVGNYSRLCLRIDTLYHH